MTDETMLCSTSVIQRATTGVPDEPPTPQEPTTPEPDDDDDVPATPPTEPAPVPMQDPPSQPDGNVPQIVAGVAR